MRKEKQMTYLYIGPVQLLPIHLPFSSRGVYTLCSVQSLVHNANKYRKRTSFILPFIVYFHFAFVASALHHQHYISYNAANSKVRWMQDKTRHTWVMFLFPFHRVLVIFHQHQPSNLLMLPPPSRGCLYPDISRRK